MEVRSGAKSHLASALLIFKHLSNRRRFGRPGFGLMVANLAERARALVDMVLLVDFSMHDSVCFSILECPQLLQPRPSPLFPEE